VWREDTRKGRFEEDLNGGEGIHAPHPFAERKKNLGHKPDKNIGTS
jgi:hypothetical protein